MHLNTIFIEILAMEIHRISQNFSIDLLLGVFTGFEPEHAFYHYWWRFRFFFLYLPSNLFPQMMHKRISSADAAIAEGKGKLNCLEFSSAMLLCLKRRENKAQFRLWSFYHKNARFLPGFSAKNRIFGENSSFLKIQPWKAHQPPPPVALPQVRVERKPARVLDLYLEFLITFP
jgi:hypothetical protein